MKLSSYLMFSVSLAIPTERFESESLFLRVLLDGERVFDKISSFLLYGSVYIG
jgi:hypothetical protein